MGHNSLHPDSVKALQQIRKNISDGQKIVFISGNFNIVHPGHLRLLRFASECGDCIIVGVYNDAVGQALMPEELRLEGVKATNWVDFAFILRDQPGKFIEHLRPDVVVKGKEHEDIFNPEAEVVASYGGVLLFGSGDISFSSKNLLYEEFKRLNSSTIIKPQDFPARHNFNKQDLKVAMDKFHRLNVLVIGDVILDEYITCDPAGMSHEDPTIVVTPLSHERFVGGAGIVAAHAQGLGATVRFFSVVGDDEGSSYVKKQLEDYKVLSNLYEDTTRPTTCKQRFRASGKTLLRVNHLRNHPISHEIQKNILDDLTSALVDVDLVIFADFNYGVLPQPLVNAIIKHCYSEGIMMVADSQSSSQIGDVSRFNNMALLTATEYEVRLAVHDFNEGLVVLAEQLRQKAMARNIFITLGSEGMLIHAEVTEKNKWLTDKLPAFNTVPKDVAGAGDSLLTCSAMAMSVGCDVWQSAYLGSLAAACQVGRVGNIPLTLQNLQDQISI